MIMIMTNSGYTIDGFGANASANASTDNIDVDGDVDGDVDWGMW